LRVDFDATLWEKSIYLDRLPYIGITLLFCLLLIAFSLNRQNIWESTQQISASKNELVEAQAVAQIGSWTHDILTNQATWSSEMFHIYGRNPQTVYLATLNFKNLSTPMIACS